MKIILAILAIGLIGVLFLGFLFVRWANRPENVEALQKKRETEAAQKIDDDRKQAELAKEIETKKANLKLVVDENFAGNRFEFLDYKYDKVGSFKFEKNEFVCSALILRGQNPQEYFIFSKEDFEDFAAEMEFGIWGTDAYAGIFWDAVPNGERNPAQFKSAYSSPNTLFVHTGGMESFGLGGVIASENNQRLRVERFGKNLKVSVNSRILFDKTVETSSGGRIGIYLGNRGGIRNEPQSISIGIKNFKVWKSS
jgi:hypothetical protein